MSKKRKATAKERKFLGKNCRVETINLSDPNLAPHHRNTFIKAVKERLIFLDEQIGNWYRHAGECGIEDCDCGQDGLARMAETMCPHLCFIKETWGEVIIDQYPYLAKFTKEFGGDTYEHLSSRPAN